MRHIHPRRRVLCVPGCHITSIERLEQSPFTNPMSPGDRQAAARLHVSGAGTHPFNGGAVRLDAVKTDRQGGLEVTLSRVEFFDFLSTNCAHTAPESQFTTGRRNGPRAYTDVLADRTLANIIAVSLVIEDSEGNIGIARRSNRVHVSPEVYSATVTGTVDHGDFREPDPFAHCAKREAAEELNLEVLKLQFNGVVISRQKLQPVFLYSTVLDVPWRAHVNRLAKGAEVSLENDAIVAVPLEQCAGFISQNDVTDAAAYQLWTYASERGFAPAWRPSEPQAPRIMPDVVIDRK